MTRDARYVLVSIAAVAVGVSIAVTGTVHQPDATFSLLGRTYLDATRLKAFIATGVAVLALGQLAFALWIYRRLPGAGAAPKWVHRAHRANGFLVVALTVPVAVHCVVAYGFQTSSPRLLVHSVAGCGFYGLFVAKVCLVRDRRAPSWALPALGGLIITAIAVIWYSAALWVLNGYHVPLLS